MDNLPLEVLDNILSQVPADLIPMEISKSLRNCSLVSHNWKSIAQPLLFMVFPLYGRHYNHAKLYEILLSCPHFQRFVKCLWIDSIILTGPPQDPDSPNPHDEPEPDLVDLESASSLFHALLSTPRFHHLILDCATAVEELYESQLSHVRSPWLSSCNLTVLSFCGVYSISIRFLYQFTAVRELHLCCDVTGFAEDGDGRLVQAERLALGWTHHQQGPLKNRPPLSHLHLEDPYNSNAPILTWFLHVDCAFDVSGLKTFYFLDQSFRIESYNLAWQFVQRLSSSLEDVAFFPHASFYKQNLHTSSEYAKFDPLPHLRQLRLLLPQDEQKQCPFPWAIHFLSGIVHPERLEELQVCFSCHGYKAEDSEEACRWKKFDIFLTSSTLSPSTGTDTIDRPTFPNLKRVCFGITVDSYDMVRAQYVADLLPSLLPKLASSGLLKVTVSTNWGYVQDSDCWHE